MQFFSSPRSFTLTTLALLGLAFGALSIKEGGTVLFGSDAARIGAGHYVTFVLWFNFLAGFAYVIAGIGLLMRRTWAVQLSWIIAITTILTAVAFGMTVLYGTAYEPRTVVAMAIRVVLWLMIAATAQRWGTQHAIRTARNEAS